MSSNRLQRLAAQWLWSSTILLQAQVAITPRVSTMLEGRTCTFRIRTVAGASPESILRGLSHPGAWTWTILEGVGSMDATTGRYTAPAVADPCLVKVRATCREDPELQAENRFLVLPFQPFDTIAKVLGPHWMEPQATDLPFMDPATGRRHDERAQVLPWHEAWRPPPPVHYGGYCQPFTLTWKHEPGADAEFLTVGAGPLLPHSQADATGQASLTVDAQTCVRRYTVEALKRVPGTSNTWQSYIQEGAIHLRGLVLHAGNEVLDPGHQDGQGLAVQFREPFGLALVHLGQEGYRTRTAVLVSDPQDHVIRLLA
jgi:hypothetical protein